MDKPIVVTYYMRKPDTMQFSSPYFTNDRYHYHKGVGYVERCGEGFRTMDEAKAWISKQENIYDVSIRDESWIDNFKPTINRRDTSSLDRWWNKQR